MVGFYFESHNHPLLHEKLEASTKHGGKHDKNQPTEQHINKCAASVESGQAFNMTIQASDAVRYIHSKAY